MTLKRTVQSTQKSLRLTIPKQVAEALHIQKGTVLEIILDGTDIILRQARTNKEE